MTSTITGPTDRQRAYLRKLRGELGEESYQGAARAAFGTDWNGGADVPSEPSRDQVSALIGLLAKTAGHEDRGHRPRPSSRRRGRGYGRTTVRCTHEDYPCCGCER